MINDNDIYRLSLDFLGGAMEVGASSILVKMCGQRILLDAGIRQKAGADPLPDFRRIQEKGGVNAIVVSHAHMDHTGSLPVISRAYPNARIYMISMTIDLTRVLLYDSIKMMNRQEEGIPAYAEKDVEQLFGRMMAVRYEQPMEILPGITLTMYQAGHIAGAACVYLTSKEGSLFYSGDFSAFAQNTIEGIRIPKLRPDVAIVESTYGDRLHSNRQVEEQALIDTAAECIAKGGKMLIPTFALGRAQEVLLILKRAMNKGELPKTKVYVDGMVRDMNVAYSRNPWFLKNALAKKAERGGELFYSDEIVAVGPKDNRDDLLKMAGPAIFVASSGMLTGGPSVEYAKKIAPMENGYIVITGYQDEEAPGRQIVELLEEGQRRDAAPGTAGEVDIPACPGGSEEILGEANAVDYETSDETSAKGCKASGEAPVSDYGTSGEAPASDYGASGEPPVVGCEVSSKAAAVDYGTSGKAAAVGCTVSGEAHCVDCGTSGEVSAADGETDGRYLTLGGTRVPVRCTLRRAGLSAHADKAEIESLLERLSARNVFLVHGDKDVIPSLAKDLQLDYRTKVFVPKDGDSEEIFLKNPRQQLKKSFPWAMQREGSPRGKEKEFYHYLTEHYPNGKFTIAELSYIWSGRHNPPEEVLSDLQEILTASPYFDRDGKRLFLFLCRSVEEIREDEKKANTMTPQRLQQEIEQCFAGFPYRKISYFMEKEEVQLLFDFPKEVEDRFDEAARQFQERTKWTVQKSQEPNEHAMQTWLHTKLGSTVQKISIRKMDSAVVVRLSQVPEGQAEPGRISERKVQPEQMSEGQVEPGRILEEIAREFERKTGYRLIFEGEGVWIQAAHAGGAAEDTEDVGRAASAGESSGCISQRAYENENTPEKAPKKSSGNGFFWPSVRECAKDGNSQGSRDVQNKSSAPVEQNLAMSCIDMEFTGAKYVPYKKSILTDEYGKYMQLSFLSPALGFREQDILQRIADQTGWRIKIAPGVNQNALQLLAQRTCQKNGVTLRKLPSYLPGTQTLVLKPARAYDQMEEICRKLEEETGVACRAE
ncbi:MAG: MBL fold metallo-hydrolase [Lachnospiraceae bacterium]|nr:MBL fold metallo-hydrolase [Lachnospiraceae bacterium]